MPKENIHRVLILLGSILWIISNIGEMKGYLPVSTIGLFVSIPITAIGILYWLKYFKFKNGNYPNIPIICKNLKSKMRKNPFYGMFFLIQHPLKFCVFLIIFSMGIVLLGFATVGQSKSVKVTQEFCENSTGIIQQTGKIKYYAVLRNVKNQYNSKSGSAEILLTFVGEKGKFTVLSKLIKDKSEWKIKELTITDINTGANNVSYEKP